jgi:transposase
VTRCANKAADGRQSGRYGTLLMDLEQSRVIDLLPERSASSFAAWLGGQHDVEIISRDRCGLDADGGRQGAPSARQITDRYHLVSNLAEAVERDIQRLQLDGRAELADATSADEPRAPQLTLIEARRERCRQARYERYQAVIDLGRRGLTTPLPIRSGSRPARCPGGYTRVHFRSGRFGVTDVESELVSGRTTNGA